MYTFFSVHEIKISIFINEEEAAAGKLHWAEMNFQLLSIDSKILLI